MDCVKYFFALVLAGVVTLHAQTQPTKQESLESAPLLLTCPGETLESFCKQEGPVLWEWWENLFKGRRLRITFRETENSVHAMFELVGDHVRIDVEGNSIVGEELLKLGEFPVILKAGARGLIESISDELRITIKKPADTKRKA